MSSSEIIQRLSDAGYSMTLIAKQSDISYMRLYRSMNGNVTLSDNEAARLRRFALVQPCMIEDK